MLTKLTKQIYLQSIAPKYFMSAWKEIKEGPPDAVLGVAEAFARDTNAKKINLGVGAYRDEQGKPLVMSSIKKAEQSVVNANLGHEYMPTDGSASFIANSQKLAFGSKLYDQLKPRLTGCQALSGTGALRIATDFIKKFGTQQTVHYSAETWPNHNNIIRDSGLQQAPYYWYDPSTKLANFKRAFDDISKLPANSFVLLHACAHNPTGCDLTPAQWKELAKLFQEKQLFAFFDMAYQGFTSGSVDTDAFAVRYFAEQNIPLLLCQSYAKNMGLYGQRVGCVSFLFNDEKTAKAAVSQLKIIARPIWSSPPLHGARIVDKVLSTPELYNEWLGDVKHVAERIAKMRTAIVANLKKAGSKCDWSHIAAQQGMFAYTGLKEAQCERLTNEFHVYLLKSGRISVAGVNDNNVEYLSQSIHEVTKNEGI